MGLPWLAAGPWAASVATAWLTQCPACPEARLRDVPELPDLLGGLATPRPAQGEDTLVNDDGLQVLVLDLSGDLVVALRRDSAFPQRVRGQVYAFGPTDPDDIEALRVAARALAVVMGVTTPTAAPGALLPRWIVSDPASPDFGKELDIHIAGNPKRLLFRDAVGIALLSEEEGWVSVENVQERDEEAWRAEKRRGPGRDPRISSLSRRAPGQPVMLAEALAKMSAIDIDAMGALNGLAAARAGGRLEPRAPGKQTPTTAQESVIKRVRRRVRSFGDRPKDMDSAGALQELLKCKDLYSAMGESSTRRDYDAGKLNVLRRPVSDQPRQLRGVAPRHVSEVLDNFNVDVMRPAANIPDDEEIVEPYWDPLLNPRDPRNRPRLLDFLRRLAERGLVDGRRRRKACVSTFFVAKKDGDIRMVVGARQPNQLHKLPPRTVLASGEALGSINLLDAIDASPEDLADFDGCFESLCAGSVDLMDGFCQFADPAWGSWMRFDIEVTADELGVDSIFDDQLGPTLVGRSVVRAPCVDDGNLVSLCAPALDDRLDRLTAELDRRGLRWHELERAQPGLVILGMVLDGREGRLRHAPKRAWRLYLALHHVLRHPWLARWQLRRIVGHIVHYFSVLRPGLSVLGASYAHISSGDLAEMVRVPPDVLGELATAAGLVFLGEVDMCRVPSDIAFTTDCSMQGYAACEARLQPWEILATTRWRERQRFVSSEVEIAPDTEVHEGRVAGLLDASEPLPLEAPPRLRRAVARRRRVELEIGVPPEPLVEALLDPARWTGRRRGAWRCPGQIHALEARAAVAPLWRAAGDVRFHGTEILSLCDNMSSVLAFEKGRATNFELLAQCRRAAAVCLGWEIRWRPRHVPGVQNVADHGSRAADRGELRAGRYRGRGALSAPTRRSRREPVVRPSRAQVYQIDGEVHAKALVIYMFYPRDLERTPMELVNDWVIVLGMLVVLGLGLLSFLGLTVVARRLGIFATFENPPASRVWHWPALERELRRFECPKVLFDSCRFGAPFKKPGAIAGSLPGLEALGLRCCCARRHRVELQGKVRHPTRGWVWRTTLASAYLPSWCRLLVSLAGPHAPGGAFGRATATELQGRAHALASAAARPSTWTPRASNEAAAAASPGRAAAGRARETDGRMAPVPRPLAKAQRRRRADAAARGDAAAADREAGPGDYLRLASLRPATLEALEVFARERGLLLSSPPEADSTLNLYFEELFFAGEPQYVGRLALHGLCKQRGWSAARPNFQEAKDALAGWSTKIPPCLRDPPPFEAVQLVCSVLDNGAGLDLLVALGALAELLPGLEALLVDRARQTAVLVATLVAEAIEQERRRQALAQAPPLQTGPAPSGGGAAGPAEPSQAALGASEPPAAWT
ncbi:unnamed protein product, partial [Prorocentrum cordatum]